MRTAYVRLFVLLGVALTLLFVPLILSITNLFFSYAAKEIDRFAGYQAEQTAGQLEFTLNKLKSYALNMYNDETIQRFLAAGEHDPILNQHAGAIISAFMINEPFIKRVYLVNSRLRILLDTESGLHSFADFSDKPLLADLTLQNPVYMNFVRRSLGSGDTLSLALPTGQGAVSEYGHLVLYVDRAMLERYLLRSDEFVSAFVMDANGHPLLGEYRDPTPVSKEADRWTVTATQLQTEPWQLVVMYDKSVRLLQATALLRQIIFLSIAALTVLLIVMLWTSRRAIAPIFRRMESIHSALREHEPLIKEEMVKQWLLQGTLNAATRAYISRETKLLAGKYVYVAVLRIDGYFDFCETYNFQSRKLLKYAACNIVEELLRNTEHPACSLDLGGDHLAVLIGGNVANPDMLRAPLQEAKAAASRLLQMELVIGLGDAKAVSDDMRFTYLHVYELTKLTFLTGVDTIYMESDYESYLEHNDPLEFDAALQRLIQAVKLGKEAEVAEILSEAERQLQSMPFQESAFRLNVFIYSILTTFGHARHMHSFEALQTFVGTFSTLRQLMDWLREELAKLMATMNGSKTAGRRSELATEIREYIHANLANPNLSADEIACHLSYSPGYIREIFREFSDCSLVEYISMHRLEKVKTLLATTDWTISEIAEHSGFQTKSHFYASFRKALGMTPNEYRAIMK